MHICLFFSLRSSFAGRSVCLLESLQSSHLRSLMESFFRQRSVRSKASGRVRARDRVSANSMSFEDFFSSLKEATGQDYRRSDVEELFNEASGKDSRVELHVLVWPCFMTTCLLLYRWTSLVMVVSDGKRSTPSYCSISSISKTR